MRWTAVATLATAATMTIDLHDPPPVRLRHLRPAPRDRAARDILLAGALPGVELPRVMSGVLHIDTLVGTIQTVVSQPIPYPWELAQLTIGRPAITAANNLALRLVAVMAPPVSATIALDGELIWGAPRQLEPNSIPSVGGFLRAGDTQTSVITLTTPIYQCLTPGRCIGLEIRSNSVATQRLDVLWTARELLLPHDRPPLRAV